MLGSSSQLSTTAEHCFVVCTDDFITTHLVVVVRSWGVTAKHLIDNTEKHICQLKALNFRVCMLLKGISNIISGICCLKGYNFSYIYFQEWDRRFLIILLLRK